MNGIVITTDNEIYIENFEEPYIESMYRTIRCRTIELVHPIGLASPYVMIVDEEGLLNGREINMCACTLYDTFRHGNLIVGNIIIAKEGYTSDGIDLVTMRCRERMALRIFPIKGRGGLDIPYTSPPKTQKIVVHGRSIGECYVYELGVDAGKQLIMDNLRVKESGPKYCHFPRNDEFVASLRYLHIEVSV